MFSSRRRVRAMLGLSDASSSLEASSCNIIEFYLLRLVVFSHQEPILMPGIFTISVIWTQKLGDAKHTHVPHPISMVSSTCRLSLLPFSCSKLPYASVSTPGPFAHRCHRSQISILCHRNRTWPPRGYLIKERLVSCFIEGRRVL